MKTSFTVTIETNNMIPVYNTEDPNEFTKENLITQQIEAELHRAIKLWSKQYLSEESLNEAILNNYIPEVDVIKVEGFDDIGDYGDIKITYLDNSLENKQPEILVEIIRLRHNDEPIEIKVEKKEEEPIPPMESDDEPDTELTDEDETEEEETDEV